MDPHVTGSHRGSGGGPAGKHSAGGWAGQQWSGPGPRGFLASATAEQREEKRSEKRIYTHTHTQPLNVGKGGWCGEAGEAGREW